eukprot:symbB.v1.2.014888.t1/scaffold1099.1/size138014/4
MKDILAPSLKVRWFNYANCKIPATKVDIGKAVPPPLIVSDAGCLDVVERLRSLELTATREIFVVTELFDFDNEGAPRFGVASQRPHCMTLRGDLRRYVHDAAMHMKRNKLTLQKVLGGWKLPQVFSASDVTCFRGSQGDGYPFLLRPFQFHCLCMALWTARPRLRTERDHLGERMTMYCDADDAKAYEVRLELCAHAALLAAGGIELPKEEKPVLVLPVIGLGGSSFHPQDAIVLALKSFRRRFTQFFHSIYVCCGDRGPNYALSDFIESAVNRSAYMMALNDSLAAKALPWHWDQREIQMSVAASRLEKIGHHMRQGPTYVVKIHDDRRSAERKQLVEKVEVQHGFGTLRAYHHRKKLQQADELIKAQRREGNWPADMVHVKLGGLRDNLELSPEFEDVEMSDLEQRRRTSLQVKASMSKINEELHRDETSPPLSPLSKDLAALQELTLSVRSSSKTRTFSGWLAKADSVTQQLGSGGGVLLHAKRRTVRTDSISVEAVVASEDVKLDTTRVARAATLSAGTDHSCWIKDTVLWCWGRGAEGQLGQESNATIGDASTLLQPVNLGSGRFAKTIESGNTHVCAILDDDSMKCWGSGDYGRLGLGFVGFIGDGPGEMGDNLPAVDLGAGRTVVDIAVGSFHSCAVLDNGGMKCWGYGRNGQLGQGATTDIGDEPFEMGENLSYINLGSNRSVLQASAGGLHTCALLDNHDIKCWGDARFGQLGLENVESMGDDANEMGDDLPAVDLGLGRTGKQVSAGAWHSCALLDDDSVKCWGSGFTGQLGHDDQSNVGDAVNELGDALPAIHLNASVRQVFAGGLHTCAILVDNSTKCWGWGFYGQLGSGATDNIGDELDEMEALHPINLDGSVQFVAAGSYHTCILRDMTGVTCFGSGVYGQLGDGSFSNIGDSPNEIGEGFPSIMLSTSTSTSGTSTISSTSGTSTTSSASRTTVTMSSYPAMSTSAVTTTFTSSNSLTILVDCASSGCTEETETSTRDISSSTASNALALSHADDEQISQASVLIPALAAASVVVCCVSVLLLVKICRKLGRSKILPHKGPCDEELVNVMTTPGEAVIPEEAESEEGPKETGVEKPQALVPEDSEEDVGKQEVEDIPEEAKSEEGPKETDVEKPQAFVPEDSEEDVGKQEVEDIPEDAKSEEGPKETGVEKPQALVPEDSEEDVGKQEVEDIPEDAKSEEGPKETDVEKPQAFVQEDSEEDVGKQERWHGIDGDVVPPLEADVSEASKKSTFMEADVKQGRSLI